MNRWGPTALAVAVVVAGLLVAGSWGITGVRAADPSAVTGSISGPTVLATHATATYTVNA